MPRPVFNEEGCKGCELCMVACPKKIVTLAARINSKGYRPATCFDIGACTGCTLCAKACPDVAIEIYKD